MSLFPPSQGGVGWVSLRIMNKKEYMIPTCEVVEMETSVSILSGSTPKVDVGFGGDLEENDQNDMSNRHRGEWGNLWGDRK